jgi:DNA-binding response OmpR family regulator
MKVLIIEPNQQHAASLSSIVRAIGHEPVNCSDPSAALVAADQTSPAVILLGISIQGLDVYKYARSLRKQDDLSQVKIIAVSGQVDDPARLREAGIETEVLKPFNRGLVTVIRESIATSHHAPSRSITTEQLS